jgi:hypothetical protein
VQGFVYHHDHHHHHRRRCHQHQTTCPGGVHACGELDPRGRARRCRVML